MPKKTIFAKGSALQIEEETAEFGPRGIIVHGRSLEKNKKKAKIAKQFSQAEFFCKQAGEPTLNEVENVIKMAKRFKADWITGIGGGSVLDLAKAAAGLFKAKEKPDYYQEGGRLKEKGLPFIAVPTTAGTGSEATINSVIINEKKRTKLSIRDDSFIARKVILDVELLKGMPKDVLSYSGIDALVQAYESYTSKNATWFSESLALKAIELINENIIPAYETASEDSLSCLLLGSYLAGIALCSSRLGVIHGIAHPLGVLYNLPHGLVCSVCFIPSIKLNRHVMGRKYDIISDVMGMDFMGRVGILLEKLKIISPFKGEKIIEKEKIIEETLSSGSTAANPKKIEREDVEFLLGEIFFPRK